MAYKSSGPGIEPTPQEWLNRATAATTQVVNLLCWAARELPLFRLLKELCDFLRSLCASSSDTVLNHLYCLWLGAQTDRPRAFCVSAPAVLRDRAEQSLQPAGTFSLNPAQDSLAVLQLLCFLLAFSAANLRGLLWGGVSFNSRGIRPPNFLWIWVETKKGRWAPAFSP